MNQDNSLNKAKTGLGMIMLLYMLGIFMGAIDTGIVSPARTVIQTSLGVDDKTGIWIINIFTLAYAASIPIAGKLADRIGRKYVYIVCILLFGVGSLICGLSEQFSSFSMLLFGRVIQAIGGGGIMPIANAEFGTTFPPEKRGMALGLLGGVYGVANILGSTAGSAVLDAFGTNNWQFLFYINLPISVFIIVLGLIFLPVNKTSENKKIDVFGTLVLTSMILSLLYGLKNINFFSFTETIKNTSVYPFLLIFILLLPILIFIEKKAEDPILNLSYFTNRKIVITLVVAAFVGICMMGMVFVPQFSENALRIASGKGGYFVTILGVFTGIGAPLSGRLVDKYGPKVVLMGGFIVSLSGALFLALVAASTSNWVTVITSLALMGTGLGFVMGSPINYMMLANTRKEDSNSALATLSLIRSIGTSIGPAIMIGFIAQAGMTAQADLMTMLPKPTAPVISQAVELNNSLTELKKDPKMAEMLKGANIPDLTKTGNMDMNISSGKALPADLARLMQSADVTNIVERTKTLSAAMYETNVPPVIEKIQDGVEKGIVGMNSGLSGMDKAISDMTDGVTGMDSAISGMSKPIAGLTQALGGMKKGIDQQDAAIKQMTTMYNMITISKGTMPGGAPSGMPSGIKPEGTSSGMPSGIMPEGASSGMPSGIMPKGTSSGMPTGNKMPSNIDTKDLMQHPEKLKQQITQLTTAKKALEKKYQDTLAQKNKLEQQVIDTQNKQKDLLSGISNIKQQKTTLINTVAKMNELKAVIPTAFDQSQKDYMSEIDSMKLDIEDNFQAALNVGFKQMYICVSIFCVLSMLLLLFYRKETISLE